MDLTEETQSAVLPTAEHIFFSNAHGTFIMIDHMFGHKIGLHKFKNI